GLLREGGVAGPVPSVARRTTGTHGRRNGRVSVTIAEQPAEDRPGGLLDWLTTTNHKKIGMFYIATTLAFFLLGGLIALVMRTELARPGLQFLSKSFYNQLFTIHGTTM